MNVLMVLSTKKYPPDRRVEREAHALVKAGHTVFMMARRGPGQKSKEVVEGVNVIRVFLPFQKTKPLADLIYFFFQRYWIYFNIVKTCKTKNIQALHVHDLPYSFATTLAGQKLGIPVIFDMHEYYVEMLRDSFRAKVHRKYKPFSMPLLWLLEQEDKYVCKRLHTAIIVAREHCDRLIPMGINKEQFVEIPNTEDVDFFTSLPLDEEILQKYKNPVLYTIQYLGGFSPHRGLHTALEAMPQVIKEIPNARLMLVGDGSTYQELNETAARLGIDEHVIFTGFVPFHKVPSYIECCDVGLIPHIFSRQIESGIANKFFQYMILGKPLIVSNIRPMVRIVNDAKCGVVFEEQNPSQLAERIVELHDQGKRRNLGQNGIEAAKTKYNWTQTAQDLTMFYEKLEKARLNKPGDLIDD